MELDVIASDNLHRHLAGRASWRLDPPEPSSPDCPGCGAPLWLDSAGPAGPYRLVGTCKAPRCGGVVAYRVCEGRFIVAERRRR